jgi:hypothetical protein
MDVFSCDGFLLYGGTPIAATAGLFHGKSENPKPKSVCVTGLFHGKSPAKNR